MTATIISVGDELLIGQVINTNTAYIGQALTGIGIPVLHNDVIGDDPGAIKSALGAALARSEIVILTGGLGPTNDDKTVEAVGGFFGSPLVFSEETWERLQKLFARFGKEPTDAHRRQCLLPQNATLLTNRMGTAPGMYFDRDGRHLFVMPGVPYEMRYIMDTHVIPMLRTGLPGLTPVLHKTICTVGEGESRLAEQIADVEKALPDTMQLAYLPSPGRVRIRVMSRAGVSAASEIDRVCDAITVRIPEFVYATEDITLAEAIGQLLLSRGMMLSVAESCTGGFLGHTMTSVPGSSAYFAGGAITYSNALKMRLLGVPASTLEQHGAVSEQTARAMAAGALQAFGTDISLAVTGVAGPDGGSDEKPVGTVWIALAAPGHVQACHYRFVKDRMRNIELSAVYALNMLRKFLTRA